jgi:hypothetical protein
MDPSGEGGECDSGWSYSEVAGLATIVAVCHTDDTWHITKGIICLCHSHNTIVQFVHDVYACDNIVVAGPAPPRH